MLGFREFDDCSFNLHLADSTIEKPIGRINDVLIVANRNYVPIDLKEICPRGNNKVVIHISLYHDKCLLFMLELY